MRERERKRLSSSVFQGQQKSMGFRFDLLSRHLCPLLTRRRPPPSPPRCSCPTLQSSSGIRVRGETLVLATCLKMSRVVASTDNRAFLLDKIESDRPLVRWNWEEEEEESRKKGSVEKEATEAAAARLSPMMATSAAPRFISPGDRRNKFSVDNCSTI